MHKSILVFILLCISNSSMYAQESDKHELRLIDSLIKMQKFDATKLIMSKVEFKNDLVGEEKYKFLSYKILLSQLTKNKVEEIRLLEEYVLLNDSNLTSNIGSPSKQKASLNIYYNKSNYSLKLVNLFIEVNDYNKALQFFKIHEEKYPSILMCGNGTKNYWFNNQIRYAEINQKLGNHDSVISRLLPSSFNQPYKIGDNIKFYENKIDSLLLVSLKSNYSNQELIQEFDKCLEFTPFNKKISIILYPTKINIFNNNIIFDSVRINTLNQLQKQKVSEIKDQGAKEKMIAEIHTNSYKMAVKNNRIYKLIHQ